MSGATRDAFVGSARAPADNAAVDAFGSGSLPLPLTALLGRDADVRTLRRWLEDPHARLITLTGPEGVGTTRLALEIGRSFATEGVARVQFVPLTAIREPLSSRRRSPRQSGWPTSPRWIYRSVCASLLPIIRRCWYWTISTAAPRDLPERQQTMNATVAWS